MSSSPAIAVPDSAGAPLDALLVSLLVSLLGPALDAVDDPEDELPWVALLLSAAPLLLLPQALRTNAVAPTAATAAISRRVDRVLTRLPPYR
ncbi:MAG: hypothetical protein ABI034_09640 [Nakamurella sp.]